MPKIKQTNRNAISTRFATIFSKRFDSNMAPVCQCNLIETNISFGKRLNLMSLLKLFVYPDTAPRQSNPSFYFIMIFEFRHFNDTHFIYNPETKTLWLLFTKPDVSLLGNNFRLFFCNHYDYEFNFKLSIAIPDLYKFLNMLIHFQTIKHHSYISLHRLFFTDISEKRFTLVVIRFCWKNKIPFIRIL